MNWEKGYSASYHLMSIDPVSWSDKSFLRMTGGTVSRSLEELMQSADIQMTENPGEQWVRVYLMADQADGSERVPIFTGLTSAPQKEMDGVRTSYQVECYSVLKPCEDKLLPLGYTAWSGDDIGQAILDLLSPTPAPVSIDPSPPTLSTPIVAEGGETYLSMVHKILTAVSWHMRIDGYGRIRVMAESTKPVAMYDRLRADAVEPQITKTDDWYACPNCLRVTMQDATAQVRDTSNGILSVPSRGREIWSAESVEALPAGYNLGGYAQKRLKELQSPAVTYHFKRRYNPDIYPGDLIRLHYPEVGVQGVYLSKSQTVTLGYGCETEEEVSVEQEY